MPKRKAAAAALSSLAGSDDESMIQADGAQERRDGARPTKKARGRPRSKSTDLKASPPPRRESTYAQPQPESSSKKSGRRGRPKGSRNSVQAAPQDEPEEQEPPAEAASEAQAPAVAESAAVSNDELAESQPTAAKPSKRSKASKSGKTGGAGSRSRSKPTDKPVVADGEFEYTPSSKRRQQPPPSEERDAPPQKTRAKNKTGTKDTRDESEVEDNVPEDAAEEVDETVLQEAPPTGTRSRSASPTKRRQSLRDARVSPSKPRTSDEPELRRKIGELTKKCDTLENRYRTLKEIGIVEANANMEKLRKQCESMTTASNNLIAALKAELEAQKALGQQSRKLQKQLQERDAEVAQLKTHAEETETQLSSAQNEVKALQTKLSAARNTAASLETAAANLKVPGSAIKGGGNRANAAANAEAAQAAQFAQLKEDLYSDLTGLIIRDIKKRQSDTLYDCIQTGSNGTLHFKLVVPHVSSTNYESAEFQYIPLLDDKRDRDLIDILPEYLTVDITFVRQQASKFYTRVIDALTKRRSTAANC